MTESKTNHPHGRVASGSAEDAFLTLWLPTVLGWCTILGGPDVSHEDAAVDIFTIALCNPTLNRANTKWVFGITRRVLRRHRALAQLRVFIQLIWNFGPASSDDGDSMPPTSDRVFRAFSMLQRVDREVLLLSVVEDRPAAEVAEILSMPVAQLPNRVRVAGSRFLCLVGEAARSQPDA